jgi:hypothetical protein
MEYLQVLFGAHSITKTVIGYYNLIDGDEDDETKLYDLMNSICQSENIKSDQLSLLKKIFDLIIEFRNNRNQVISSEQLESTKQLCGNYVNWVFSSFPCFIKGENGQYFFRSN